MADRQYELVYILPPDTTEQQVTELHEQVAQIVARMNGQIEKNENWGRRRLAYEITTRKAWTSWTS
jgi:small subunit ribosomal protein S6